MPPALYPDWHYNPLPMLAWKGTPEEREAAVRYLVRVSRRVPDGAAGLPTVLRALGLDDDHG